MRQGLAKKQPLRVAPGPARGTGCWVPQPQPLVSAARTGAGHTWSHFSNCPEVPIPERDEDMDTDAHPAAGPSGRLSPDQEARQSRVPAGDTCSQLTRRCCHAAQGFWQPVRDSSARPAEARGRGAAGAGQAEPSAHTPFPRAPKAGWPDSGRRAVSSGL